MSFAKNIDNNYFVKILLVATSESWMILSLKAVVLVS